MGHRNIVHTTSESSPLDTVLLQNKFGHSEVTFFGNGCSKERPSPWNVTKFFSLKNHFKEFSKWKVPLKL